MMYVSRGVCSLVITAMVSMNPEVTADFPKVHVPEFKREELPNGLTILAAKHSEQPVIFLSLLIRAGSLNEPEGLEGLASTVTEMLQEGTENYDSSSMARLLDELGGSFGATAGRETTVLSSQMLVRNKDKAIELLAETALRPTFPNSSLRRIKQQQKTMLRASYIDAGFIGSQHLAAMVYGRQTRYGRFQTEQSVSKVSRQSLTSFYHKYYQPNGAVLCALGDFEPDAMIEQLKLQFSNWEQGESPTPVGLPESHEYLPRRRLAIKKDKTQSTIIVGGRGVPSTSERSEAFALANHILGASGFSSRLMNAVRSEEGKTYGIHSSNSATRLAATFTAQTFTRNDNVRETIEIIMKVIRDTVADGVTVDELTKAKTAMIGQFPLRFENPGNWAGAAVNDLFFERPLSYTYETRERIARTTLDEVNGALRETIEPDKLSILVVGDPDSLKGQLDAFGDFEIRKEKGDWYGTD